MFHNRTPLQKLLLLKAFSSGGQSFVERTATGNPLTFGTDVSKPLKSLLIPFTPIQSGTGDPSPSNIRSIIPWNGLTVFGGGKNLLNLNRTEGTPNPTTTLVSPRVMDTDHFYIGLHDANYYVKAYASGSVQDGVVKVTSINNNSYGLGFPVAVKGGSKYTFNCTAEKVLIGIGYYDAEWNFISSGGDIYKSQIPATRTTPENASYMIIIFRSSVGEEYTYSDIQLEAGQTATAYEPYKPITDTDIVFPSPVYGGTLDVVSGVLTVEYGFITLDDSVSVALANWRPSDGTSAWLYSLSAVPSDTATNSAICDKVKQNSYGIIYGGSVGVTTNVISGDFGLAIRVPVENLTTEEAIHAYLAENPYHVAYKLATPQEIQLTPAQITALVGDNTIWSDADGSMTCVYLVSSKYAEEHPVGGLGSGLGSGLLGSGTGDNPDEPTEPDEPIEEPVGDGHEEGDTE